jgi:hypothetical protein
MFVGLIIRVLQKSIFYILLISAVAVVINSCANIGSPVGGPKDVTPPKVVKTNPPDSSVNLTGQKKITITFDEFVVLKDVAQELMISPPLKEDVTPVIINKSLVIEFPKEVVFDTTTYTLSFGNSIADNNEGNILTNYEFVFSLKSYIDSLSVEGKVINSFDLTTDKESMYVMLYENLADSAPIKEKPKYISRTNKQGNFSLHNLEPGFYRIFALKDANSNFLYDLPEEQIAFGDSIIELAAEKLEIKPSPEDIISSKKDTIKKIDTDEGFKLTAAPMVDTSSADSAINVRKYVFHQELRFFKQAIKNQYMTNNLRPQAELLLFTFNQPLFDTFQIKSLNYNPTQNWYIRDINKTNDTLKYWITDTSMISIDSLQFEASYPVYDSLGEIIQKTDTLQMSFRPKKVTEPAMGKKNRQKYKNQTDSIPVPVKRIELSNNLAKRSAFDLDQPILIILAKPLKEVRKEKISMYRYEDTLAISLLPDVEQGQTMYNFAINFKPEEKTSYKLIIPDSTVFDIYGNTNDSLEVTFQTQSEDYYGALKMKMNNIDMPVILQLMDEKEELVREARISESQSVNYKYLVPKKYLLKLIIDSNNNGKWDPGNYLLKRQPEKVIYYSQPINVRSNWEIEMNWYLDN